MKKGYLLTVILFLLVIISVFILSNHNSKSTGQYIVINKNIKIKVDGINADRKSGKLIIYTAGYGKCSKPFGNNITEFVVVNNVIVKKNENGKNGTYIPRNGFVVCFYKPAKGIADSLKIGDEAVALKVDVATLSADSHTQQPLFDVRKTSYTLETPKEKKDNPTGWDDANNRPSNVERGQDQLIIYNSSYGMSTGTNQWGYEITLDKDERIIKLGGNNSSIPVGGSVISGHGLKADWLRENAKIGSIIAVNKQNKEIELITTPASYIDRCSIKINSTMEEIEVSKKQFRDIPYSIAEQHIQKASDYLKNAKVLADKNDYDEMLSIIEKAGNEVDAAHFTNCESRRVENRGVWIRPKETNLSQVAEKLNKLQETNVNQIYIETWWGGYTIYPTDNKITCQNPIYNGFDVLKAYIDEAHKRGMEVHSWVENFFIGDSATYGGGPVYSKKPGWLLMSRKGENYQLVEEYNTKYYFANPALPEVRDFVSGIYNEILKKYDIDGLQLDYVRYPDAGDGTNDFGYDSFTRGLFIKQKGVDPINIKPDNSLWKEWCKFRADLINTFVYKTAADAKAIKPNIIISADVWPNYVDGPKTLMQEPKEWVTKGYIDNIVPMSYNIDPESTAEDTKNTVEFAKGHSFVTIGVGPYMELDRDTIIGQLRAANDNGADGTALFEYETLFKNGYPEALIQGLYRNKAVTCFKDPMLSVSTVINEILRKMDSIYYPQGGIDEKSCRLYKKKLSDICNGLKSTAGSFNQKKGYAIRAELQAIVKETEGSADINNEVKSRITADIDSCINILSNYISKAEN